MNMDILKWKNMSEMKIVYLYSSIITNIVLCAKPSAYKGFDLTNRVQLCCQNIKVYGNIYVIIIISLSNFTHLFTLQNHLLCSKFFNM